MTDTERTTESITSPFVRVRIEVEPNKVVHTSPERFVGGAKRFRKRYPNASEPTLIIPTAASAFTMEEGLLQRRRTANTIVTARTKYMLFEKLSTVATASAPNAE